MAVIKDLGAVTAYASAVEGGYTGTKEEFATLMASYATVAEEAAESAESASQSATQASASAQTATTKASEASQSATQAGTKASQASTSATQASASATSASQSAQIATTKASEASASATTASTKASEASASATSAQTAQGLAEVARDGAIDAKTDAESARDMAQQYAESIDPENIYSAYPTDTASGSVASFADGADDIPMKSVKVAIEPVQDLHGQDAPYPAGGGKNKLDPTTATGSEIIWGGVTLSTNNDVISLSGTAIYNGGRTNLLLKTIHLAAGTYYISATNTSGTQPAVVVQTVSGSIYTVILDRVNASFTLAQDSDIAVGFTIVNGTAYSSSMKLQIESGSVATDYAPYSNICPITGWTGAQVSHSGADTSNPTTYPITFPTEAGTVYGGELDVTNGVLTVDRAIVDLGTLNWRYTAANYGKFYTDLPVDAKLLIGVTGSLCSRYAPTKADEWQRILNHEYILREELNLAGRCAIAIEDDDYTDPTAFKTAMSGVQLVYELATSIVYTLTPTEIKSLLGDNNVWADAGDTEVTYRADTVKYIDKKLGKDAPMIATDNIVSGSYFMVGSNLYKATANIANGAAVVVGTNATAKTMAEALNEINA